MNKLFWWLYFIISQRFAILFKWASALTKHAAQSGHVFNWDYAYVLHRVNNYHKRIFLESLYINLKTNTVNDKSANFPATYYKFLKHDWSLSVIYLTLSLSSYWPPLYL